LDTIWLSVSAGTGPEECAHAAALTLDALLREAADNHAGLAIRVIETEASRLRGNIRSALIALEGNGAASFAEKWTGVIQWIWRSAYRPLHSGETRYRRKNSMTETAVKPITVSGSRAVLWRASPDAGFGLAWLFLSHAYALGGQLRLQYSLLF
jgi:protein subunit release factor B